MNSAEQFKPTYFLEVWRGRDSWCWTVRQFTTLNAFKKEYDYTFSLFGRTATVFIGSDDYELTKEEAIKIAKDTVAGNVIEIKIDMTLCGGLPRRLQSNLTPRH